MIHGEREFGFRSFLGRIVIFLVCLFVFSEVFFRVVLPARQYPLSTMNSETQIRCYGGPSQGLFTYGQFCDGRYQWRINPQGWNSPYDYTNGEQRENPMVALVGDSYIEGFWADLDDHMEVQLHELSGGEADFYSFGTWGAMLSQYLVVSRYVISNFNPDALVIFLNDEDVTASLNTQGAPVHLCHTVQQMPDLTFQIVPPPQLTISRYIPLALKSATLRYLKTNRNLEFLARGGVADRNANTSELNQNSQQDSLDSSAIAVTEYLLDEFNSLSIPVIIVLDCPRGPVYRNDQNPTRYLDCALVQELSEFRDNISCIDLLPVFQADWANEGRMFSASDNPHWNSYGNKVVAESIFPEVMQAVQRHSIL